MKYIGILFFVFCFADAIAQPIDSLKYRDLVGFTQKSCYLYAVRNYLTTDTILGPVKKYGVLGSDSTIYIVRAEHTKDWPDTMAGFHIVYIDLEDDKEKLYKEQRSKNMPVLYISRFVHEYDRYFCNILPVVFKNKREITYGHDACKMWFTYDYSIAQFYYTNKLCYSY